MNCDQVKELLEEYVLDTLDADERLLVEHHLATCPDCQMRGAELAEIAHTLPQAVAAAAPLQPPAALKQRLLQNIQDKVDIQPGLQAEAEGRNNIQANSKKFQPAHQGFAPMHHARAAGPKDWRRSRVVGVGGALILLIMAVVLGARLGVVLAEGRALQAELSTLYDQQELVLEVIDSDQTVKRLLRAQIPPGESGLPAYGKLYTRQGLPHVVAMAARLPQPPEGQAYHLWVAEDGQTRLAGVLTLNDQGFGLLVFDAESGSPNYDNARLTLQPAGSDTPSDESILLWNAAQP